MCYTNQWTLIHIATNFKKLLLVKFWYTIKEYP